MSLKIGQVNLINDTATGKVAFNVMYHADDAFKARPPSSYGCAVYAGKKKLSACRDLQHSKLSSTYTNDETSEQGFTNQKGIKDWKTADSEPGRIPPRGWTGLEDGKRAVNMFYASSAGSKENQAAMGAGSGGVHTIITYADGKIMDAKVVTVELKSDIKDNQGEVFPEHFGIAGDDKIHMTITQSVQHDEANNRPREDYSTASSRESLQAVQDLEEKLELMRSINVELVELIKTKLM